MRTEVTEKILALLRSTPKTPYRIITPIPACSLLIAGFVKTVTNKVMAFEERKQIRTVPSIPSLRALSSFPGTKHRSLWILSFLSFATVPLRAHFFDTTPTAFSPTRTLPRSFSLQHTMPRSNDFSATSLGMAKLDSPSAQRNKEPIWNILSERVFGTFPKDHQPFRILEIAAGCGVHVEHFSTNLSSWDGTTKLEWYPTDPEETSRRSIESYVKEGKLNEIGVQTPLAVTLDENGIMEKESLAALFPDSSSLSSNRLNAIICINMIHISPWTATLGLFKLAGESIDPDHGVLYCYGPYKENGTAVESNLNFDQSLKSRNPEWGVRDLEQVCQAASDAGLELVERIEMPANNLSLIFRKKKQV